MLLASSSQDKFIRVWRIERVDDDNTTIEKVENLIKSMKITFDVDNNEVKSQYAITLESVICGHEGWVYDVKWSPKVLKGNCDFISILILFDLVQLFDQNREVGT